MPQNIKFERREDLGHRLGPIKEREAKAREDAARLERSATIDREELEARTFLAQREVEFRGTQPPSKAAAREILETYNAVVADGRHVGTFLSYPAAAAELVGTEMSEEASRWLREQGNLTSAIDFGAGSGGVMNPGVVAVAVVVVVLEVTHSPGEEFVLDPAGQLKF